MTSPANSQRIVRIALACGLLALALIFTLYFVATDQPLTGVGGDDEILGGDFTLNSAEGEVSLSDFEGKLVVVYFGFLNCPDICPTSMAIISRSLEAMSDRELDKVQALLISIDPARDSLQDLIEYGAYFHPGILGLTGTQEQIDAVTLNYGAHFKVTDADKTDYGFFHSSRYYIVNQSGQLVDAMRHSTTSNELTARLRSLM